MMISFGSLSIRFWGWLIEKVNAKTVIYPNLIIAPISCSKIGWRDPALIFKLILYSQLIWISALSKYIDPKIFLYSKLLCSSNISELSARLKTEIVSISVKGKEYYFQC